MSTINELGLGVVGRPGEPERVDMVDRLQRGAGLGTVGGDGFTDDETSSTWNLLGVATDGPEAGTELEAVDHVDTFWFAWSSYHPETELVDH